MSWLEDLQNKKLEIKTGDGKTYFPLWKGGQKDKEYKNSVFDFIDVSGDFIDRKKPGSPKYELVFFFQGDDHFEVSQSFEDSADDPRAWEVNHPYYGLILGQPLSLSRGNKNLNLTEIKVEFWETIEDNGIKRNASIPDEIEVNSLQVNESSANAFESKVELNSVDQSTMKQNFLDLNLNYNSILDDLNYSEYQSIFNQAIQSIDNIILSPVQAIRDINTLINLPNKIISSIGFRLELLKAVFNDIKGILDIKSNKSNKAYFEAAGAAVITSFCSSLITLEVSSDVNASITAQNSVNISTFQEDIYSRSQISAVAAELVDIYEEYLTILDEIQVPITDIQNSFSISYETQSVINAMVSSTLFNIYSVAFEAKQEREVILETDSNLIILVHKYIGLDNLDLNLERFRKLNNIRNRRVFSIKKGKSIKYFL